MSKPGVLGLGAVGAGAVIGVLIGDWAGLAVASVCLIVGLVVIVASEARGLVLNPVWNPVAIDVGPQPVLPPAASDEMLLRAAKLSYVVDGRPSGGKVVADRHIFALPVTLATVISAVKR